MTSITNINIDAYVSLEIIRNITAKILITMEM